MSQKVLISFLVISIIVALGFVCSNISNQQQSGWTQSSENLLKVRDYQRKPLDRDSLF